MLKVNVKTNAKTWVNMNIHYFLIFVLNIDCGNLLEGFLQGFTM